MVTTDLNGVVRAFNQDYDAKTSNESFFVEVINDKVTVVYSYGYHFPIAISFNDGYLFNKDGYSMTTSRHKNLILRQIEHSLSETDYKDTNELKEILQKVRYDNLNSKAEIVEQHI